MAWRLPPETAFVPAIPAVEEDAAHVRAITQTLRDHAIDARIMRHHAGPSTIRYDLELAAGQKLSGLTAILPEIRLAVGGSNVSMESARGYVGLYVPREQRQEVRIASLLDDLAHRKQALPVAIGISAHGHPVTADLAAMPHLLIAGATGAGKSVCLNVLLTSLLARRTPDQVQMMMIDPKRVELTPYSGIPHLMQPVITDPLDAQPALAEAVRIMEERYVKLERGGWKSIEDYNRAHRSRPWPRLLIIIDELADLMLAAREQVETSITRLAAKARAAGIHLIIATQRPSKQVVTGLIKGNIPSRIAFAVSSNSDSRIILDRGGAEALLGRGDALYSPVGAAKPIRMQCAYVDNKEIERVVRWWSVQTRQDDRVAS